jgi:hypothetical protein
MKGWRIAVAATLILAMAGTVDRPAAAQDCGFRSVSVSGVQRVEGGPQGGGVFTFEVTTSGCAAATVDYETTAAPANLAQASAPADYTRTVGSLSWSQGDTTGRIVQVPIVGETLVEPDESFSLRLVDRKTSAVSSGIGTIINDDSALIGVEPYTCDENEGDDGQYGTPCPVPVKLVRLASFDILVRYETVDGTASAGEDYMAVHNGTLIIPAGQSVGYATVRIRRDHLTNESEYFYVRIFEPSVGTITVAQARVTIVKP